MIRRDGAQRLTLDAVAAESGVSKGGVLYHFATKRALVDGLLERWLTDFDRRLEAAGANLLVEYVRCSDLSDEDPDVAATEFGMLAGMIDDPQVLEVVRTFQEKWMERMLAGGIDPAAAWTGAARRRRFVVCRPPRPRRPQGRRPPGPARAPTDARARGHPVD